MQKEEIDILYESLGNLIRIHRKKAGFSQEALANKLGLSRASVVNMEKGRQHPSIHMLVEISRLLTTPLSTFINDDMFVDKKHRAKLNQFKKEISKTSEEFDQEKILNFIKQNMNQS